jgi:hypothetical protein
MPPILIWLLSIFFTIGVTSAIWFRILRKERINKNVFGISLQGYPRLSDDDLMFPGRYTQTLVYQTSRGLICQIYEDEHGTPINFHFKGEKATLRQFEVQRSADITMVQANHQKTTTAPFRRARDHIREME